MRALYQLVWVLLVVALLLVFRVGPRSTVLRAAAFPVAFLLAFSIKQAVMFGTPTTTTWFGENLARIAIFTAPKDERERLVHEGKLSRIALVRTFAPLEAYRGIVKPSARQGVPALDERWKSNHKDLNLNNYGYIAVSNAYRHQALRQIKERPGQYARGVKLAAERFLWPASYTGLPGQNIEKLSAWRSVYDVLYGSSARANRVSFFLGLGYLVAGAFGLAVLLRERGPLASALSFIWLTLIYTTLVGTLTDYGENYRLRFAVDPIAATLLSVACYRAWVAVHSRIRGRRSAARRDGEALA